MNNAPVKDDQRITHASKAMIRRVRRHLKRFGLVPVEPTWRLAWKWAHRVSIRNELFVFDRSFTRRKLHWPSSEEIATQYVVLLLATMQGERALKLPFHADLMPDDVRVTLAGASRGRRLVIKEDPDGILEEKPALQVEAARGLGHQVAGIPHELH